MKTFTTSLFTIASITLAVTTTSFIIPPSQVRHLKMDDSEGKTISAYCVFDQDKCEGEVRLRYYVHGNGDQDNNGATSDSTTSVCTSTGGCDTIDKDMFSVMKTCSSDIVEDAKKHINDDFVAVEFFPDQKSCEDDGAKWEYALAVTLNDKCYPSIDGKSSYRAQYETTVKSIKWMSYEDNGKCEGKGDIVTFKESDLNSNKCVQEIFRVTRVQQVQQDKDTPSSSGSKVLPVIGFGWYMLSYLFANQ